MALKHLFDTGKRPLRTGKVANKDPVLVSNLMGCWGDGWGIFRLAHSCGVRCLRVVPCLTLHVVWTVAFVFACLGIGAALWAASRGHLCLTYLRFVVALQVANLLLLWLGSLPEPLFPQAYVPDLLRTQQSDCYMERVAAVRGFLKKVRSMTVHGLSLLYSA